LKRTLGMNRVCNQTESKWCKVPTWGPVPTYIM
jgi:hypothetical protein